SKRWENILLHLSINDKELHSVIALIPATIIVCESLFASRKAEVVQLRSVKSLDFNTILKRLSGRDLFDLAGEIARTWEMSDKTISLIQGASGLREPLNAEEKTLSQWMHLLLFYELSQSVYVSAGLNEFIDFQIDFVGDIYEPFMQVMA
ncbi:MAG: histidine kinase, partial [Sulfuricurvum sp.]|nr:histidine kinase [Sulfuricurvum sp.]